LRYDSEAGYLGFGLKTGNIILSVSVFDRILIIQKEGTYFVTDAPEKLFVGKGLRHCGFADKDTLESLTFTIIYQEKTLKYLFIKRCKITQYILNKTYELLPSEGYKLIPCRPWMTPASRSSTRKAKATRISKPAPGSRVSVSREARPTGSG